MTRKELFPLLQGFASLAPVKNIEWPSRVSSTDEIQDFLVEQLINSPHFQSYPPSRNYRRSFWKWIIMKFEGKGCEVREEIYSHYLSLLDESSAQTIFTIQLPQPSYVTYIWSSPSELNRNDYGVSLRDYRKCTLFEARTFIESGTTGLRTWPPSFILADYLIKNWCNYGSERILELGSGAGFLGIVLAQLQTESLSQALRCSASNDKIPALYLSDLNELVLSRCESNLKLPCNNILSHPEIHFRALDWSDALDEIRADNLSALLSEANADLILGADVVYDVAAIPSLVSTLRLALTRGSTDHSDRQAIIAAALRNESTISAFVHEIRKAKLDMEEIEPILNSFASQFLYNQPDVTVEEGGNQVKLFSITCKTNL